MYIQRNTYPLHAHNTWSKTNKYMNTEILNTNNIEMHKELLSVEIIYIIMV